ncbi:hypothetical protein ONZ45_g3129 [Pleurotus djamor]|nr:hypothetical protein ONZ45_g3129 [Pleurotus djamor]
MSTFTTPGVYKLRAEPFEVLGYMLATSNGEGADITIEPEVPGVGHQIWMTKEGNDNTKFMIVDRKDPAYGWTATEPEVALTLTKKPTVFSAKGMKGDDGKDIVAIYVAEPGEVGSTWYVGTSGNAVIIQPVPVIANPP